MGDETRWNLAIRKPGLRNNIARTDDILTLSYCSLAYILVISVIIAGWLLYFCVGFSVLLKMRFSSCCACRQASEPHQNFGVGRSFSTKSDPSILASGFCGMSNGI